jgi:hypothetical protein
MHLYSALCTFVVDGCMQLSAYCAPVTPKRSAPQQHPRPFQSALWSHLDAIRSLRHKRMSWSEIASYLETNHGLQVTRGTVHNFFKRATKRDQPIGFDAPAANNMDNMAQAPGVENIVDDAIERASAMRKINLKIITHKQRTNEDK